MGTEQVSSSSRPKKESSPGAAKKSAKKRRPPRSLSVYNIFFGHERARILALSLLSGGQKSVQDLAPPSNLSVEDVRRFVARNPYDAPGAKAKKRRKHRKTHGMVSFVELNRIVSRNWKALDMAGKAPFYEVAKELKAKLVVELEQKRKQQKLEASGEDRTNKETAAKSDDTSFEPKTAAMPTAPAAPTFTITHLSLSREVLPSPVAAFSTPPASSSSSSRTFCSSEALFLPTGNAPFACGVGGCPPASSNGIAAAPVVVSPSTAPSLEALEPVPFGGVGNDGDGGGAFASSASADTSVLSEFSEVLLAVFAPTSGVFSASCSPPVPVSSDEEDDDNRDGDEFAHALDRIHWAPSWERVGTRG